MTPGNQSNSKDDDIQSDHFDKNSQKFSNSGDKEVSAIN